MSKQPHEGVESSPLFSFVVVADTHVNEGEQTSISPFETNRLANARVRHVFAEIAAMEPPPRFVIHLGDIVHPMPSLPAFHNAVAQFRGIAAWLSVPLHVIPGNHDVGDKTVDWMPAGCVCDAYLEIYRTAFGEDYYAFDDCGVRFVLMNSLLLNSGLAGEARQREWVERQIDTADDLRVFLFMHYPPYIYAPDECGNYDNIDEPARSWLLAQISKPVVEAVFAGHVHNFWYDRVGDAELYMLPSTSFLRHDFSEFYKVEPGLEFGRGDVAKFGYFRIDVLQEGHVAYPVRTMGAQCGPDEKPRAYPRRHLTHPRISEFDQVGVELRHPWAEVMQITATGGVQEFGRKWARNDYPLLALWEMGVRLSKVPEADLLEPEPRKRMGLMARLGHAYIVTVLGAPGESLRMAADGASGVVAFEANFTLEGFEQHRASLAVVREASGANIYFAKILTEDGTHFDGKTFSHFVNSGFSLSELDSYRGLLIEALAKHEIDGITVRLDMHEPLPAAAARLRAFSAETGCRVLASLKLSGSSLAHARTDDRETVARAAQAMVLSRAGSDVCYVFDTFMDVDRGYYPRHAFIDRRFNPHPAARVFTTLAALFAGRGPFTLLEEGRCMPLVFMSAGLRYQLTCATQGDVLAQLSALPDAITVHDLYAGTEASLGELRMRLESNPAAEDALCSVLVTLDS